MLPKTHIKPKHVHVVGGGLSGLACAIRLVDAGVPVTLYEASMQAGGRCRSYEDKTLNCTLDNGNHLILRGNKAAWSTIKRLGSFGEFYAATSDYIFHDVKAQRQWSVTPPLVKDAWQGWRLLMAGKPHTVAQCFDTNSRFYREFVEPLCLAALNTHPKVASAHCLRNVWLRMLVPTMADYLQIRTDFNRALIEPALKIIGQVELAQRLREVQLENGRVTGLQFTGFHRAIGEDERVVLALPADAVAKLVPSLKLPNLTTHTIINGHFLCDTDELVPRLLGVIGSPLHWVFLKEGVISTTTSHAETTGLKGDIAETLWAELGKCYAALKGKPMPAHRIVTEKRATIAATPENLAKRPPAETNIPNLTLAGDWLQSPLPACIENAIASGNRAGDWCLRNSPN